MNGLANLSYCQRAVIELQSAYYAFTAGFKHKATISDICQKLDHCVEKVFTPAPIDGHAPSNIKRKLLSLLEKLGVMEIVIFADIAKTEYQNSRTITKPLTKLHLEQSTEYNINREVLAKTKNNIKNKNRKCYAERLQKFINRFTNKQNSFKRNN